MADIRPKDLLPTAERPAADDYLILDGAMEGTRKISATAAVAHTTVDATNGAEGATKRPLAQILAEHISVKDFGAKGDGTTDDSDAIEAAIAEVATAPGTLPSFHGSKSIFFPKGRYRVTRSVFSYLPSAGLKGPIQFRGENGMASQILLDPPSASETWLYNNGSSGAYSFNKFTDLGFSGTGPNATYASGFRLYGAGWEQGFDFTRCFFGWSSTFRRLFLLTGSTNADTLSCRDCRIRNIKAAVLTFDQTQAVVIHFDNTSVEDIHGDIIVVTAAGGGHFNAIGGSWIWGTGTSKGWLLNVTGSNNVNHPFYFNGIRPELYHARAGLVKKTGAAGEIEVVFNNVPFPGVANQYGTFDAVEIARGATIRFNECLIAKEMLYRFMSSGAGNKSIADNGTLLFDNCRVPPNLSSKITFESDWGFASARGCQNFSAATAPEAVDFDLKWNNPACAGRSLPLKTVAIKNRHTWWPNSYTASKSISDAWTESTVLLPVNSRIVGFRIYKPIIGGTQAEYQLHIGNGDKTAIYASSSLGAQNAAHVIDVTLPLTSQILTGTTLNSRTVRLWANPGGGASSIEAGADEEIALVEYF